LLFLSPFVASSIIFSHLKAHLNLSLLHTPIHIFSENTVIQKTYSFLFLQMYAKTYKIWNYKLLYKHLNSESLSSGWLVQKGICLGSEEILLWSTHLVPQVNELKFLISNTWNYILKIGAY
jgi:hypothetical protein